MTTSLPRLFQLVGIAPVFIAIIFATNLATGAEGDRDEIFAKANAAFESGDYDAAEKSYRGLAEAGLISADLFFNLGTTLYRLDEPGEAILWMRRATVIDPTLPEVRQNLAFLRSRIGFLEFTDSGLERFLRSVPVNSGIWIATILVWLSLLAIAAGFFVPAFQPKRSALIAAAAVGLLFAVVGWRLQHHRDHRLAPENFSTIVADQTSAQTAPTPDAKSVIALPPGSEVRVLQETGPWAYVDIPGDFRGWLKAEQLAAVWPVDS